MRHLSLEGSEAPRVVVVRPHAVGGQEVHSHVEGAHDPLGLEGARLHEAGGLGGDALGSECARAAAGGGGSG